MQDFDSDLWLVARLARQSFGTDTLRLYWSELETHRAGRSALTSGVAWVVYVALVPIVPLVAARHRRLLARAVEGVVRAVVAGVDVPTALNRAVAWLERKRRDPLQARADLERLLAGFLSAPSGDASAAELPPRTGSDLTSGG